MYCTRIRVLLAATMNERGVDLSVTLVICSENGRWPAVISNSAIGSHAKDITPNAV